MLIVEKPGQVRIGAVDLHAELNQMVKQCSNDTKYALAPVRPSSDPKVAPTRSPWKWTKLLISLRGALGRLLRFALIPVAVSTKRSAARFRSMWLRSRLRHVS